MSKKAKSNLTKHFDRYRPTQIRADAERDYQQWRQTGKGWQPHPDVKKRTWRILMLVLLGIALLALVSVIAASR